VKSEFKREERRGERDYKKEERREEERGPGEEYQECRGEDKAWHRPSREGGEYLEEDSPH